MTDQTDAQKALDVFKKCTVREFHSMESKRQKAYHEFDLVMTESEYQIIIAALTERANVTDDDGLTIAYMKGFEDGKDAVKANASAGAQDGEFPSVQDACEYFDRLPGDVQRILAGYAKEYTAAPQQPEGGA